MLEIFQFLKIKIEDFIYPNYDMFKILGQFGESVISNNLIFSENQDEMKGGGMKAILKWIIFKSGKKKIKKK